jgi:hypothetical protein
MTGYNGSEYELEEFPVGCVSTSCAITLLTQDADGELAVDGGGDVYLTEASLNGEPAQTTVTELPRATAPSLTFPVTEDGDNSNLQTVVIQNIGNESLTFPIPSSGNNPTISTNFTFTSSNLGSCPLATSSSTAAGPLKSGSICTLPISFSPGSGVTGSVSGSLVLTDTSLNAAAPGYAKQTIKLTGTATAP